MRSRAQNEVFSRETFLLGNNVLLMAAMLVVLLGTLLPLIHKQLGMGSISIGEPFFNSMFTWLMAPFALLMGIGPLIRWRRDEAKKWITRLLWAFAVCLLLSLSLPRLMGDEMGGMTLTGLMMSLWVFVLTLMELHERAAHRQAFWRGLARLTRSHWGMVLGHLGVAVTVFGITFSQNYSLERDVRMKTGDSVEIKGYRFMFRDVRDLAGPNYTGAAAVFDVTHNGKPEARLQAEKRYYSVSRTVTTQAAISGGFTRDLYAALGEEMDDGAWAVRLYYKPFVAGSGWGDCLWRPAGCAAWRIPVIAPGKMPGEPNRRTDENQAVVNSPAGAVSGAGGCLYRAVDPQRPWR